MENSQAYDLFTELSKHPLEVAINILHERIPDDAELADSIEGLLRAHADTAELPNFAANPDAQNEFKSLIHTTQRLSGARLGQYTLQHKIGEGYSSIIYTATREGRDVIYALKILNRTFATSESVRRLRYEFNLLQRLDHEAIARAYELGEDRSSRTLFIAMEYVKGIPIDTFVRNADLPQEAVLRLFLRVCDGVRYLHQRGILHRDIKPSNILVTQDTQPKILDFGIGRLIDTNTDTRTRKTTIGRVVGTIGFMSPEQAIGDPAATDTRSDVYGLGALLFKLLTAETPHEFENESIVESLRKIEQTPPRRLSQLIPNVNRDLDRILVTALHPSPSRRYQSVPELIGDLGRYLKGKPISASPPGLTYTAYRYFVRHKVSSMLVAMMCVGTLIGSSFIGYWFAQHREIQNSLERVLYVDELLEMKPSREDLLEIARIASYRNKSDSEVLLSNSSTMGYRLYIGQSYKYAEVYFQNAYNHHRDTSQLLTKQGFWAVRGLAFSRISLGRTDEGIGLLNEYLNLCLADPDAAWCQMSTYYSLSEAHNSAGSDPTVILDYCNKAIIASAECVNPAPMLFSVQIARAFQHGKTGQIPRAKEILEEVISSAAEQTDLHPRQRVSAAGKAMRFLAGYLWADAEFEQAEKMFKDAIAMFEEIDVGTDLNVLTTDYVGCVASLGVVLRDQRKYEEAEEVLKRRVQLGARIFARTSPNIANNHENIARLYLYMGRYDDCIEHANVARMHHLKYDTANADDLAQAEFLLGLAKFEKSGSTESIRLLDSALRWYDEFGTGSWLEDFVRCTHHRVRVLKGQAIPDLQIIATTRSRVAHERGDHHPVISILDKWHEEFQDISEQMNHSQHTTRFDQTKKAPRKHAGLS